MSKKHVEDYFNQICDNYHEMIETLKDMEEECTKGLVSPDRVEQLKNMIEPIKSNYSRISYIMFLLNMPNKKEKQKWYNKENKNKTFEGSTLKEVLEENKKALNNSKDMIK